ncbi:hypothetical protein ACLZX5_14340 [Enterococcus faecium]
MKISEDKLKQLTQIEVEPSRKGRLFFSRQKMNWVKIQIDLDLAEFQIAWQFNKLFVWWNAEEITDYVKDVKFICDKEGTNKIAELTVLEELLIPRNYKLL